jgi:hypothetical protein
MQKILDILLNFGAPFFYIFITKFKKNFLAEAIGYKRKASQSGFKGKYMKARGEKDLRLSWQTRALVCPGVSESKSIDMMNDTYLKEGRKRRSSNEHKTIPIKNPRTGKQYEFRADYRTCKKRFY